MGGKYIEPPLFNLTDSYKNSNCCTPLIFILSQGTDPMSSLIKFAEVKKIKLADLLTISLGQGQVINYNKIKCVILIYLNINGNMSVGSDGC